MSEHIDDGGAAFPVPDVFRPDGHHAMAGWYGMSLRDWMAGQALMGAMASEGYGGPQHVTGMARFAYEMADAMLRARKDRAP
jgi:hypothetical protein